MRLPRRHGHMRRPLMQNHPRRCPRRGVASRMRRTGKQRRMRRSTQRRERCCRTSRRLECELPSGECETHERQRRPPRRPQAQRRRLPSEVAVDVAVGEVPRQRRMRLPSEVAVVAVVEQAVMPHAVGVCERQQQRLAVPSRIRRAMPRQRRASVDVDVAVEVPRSVVRGRLLHRQAHGQSSAPPQRRTPGRLKSLPIPIPTRSRR
jgi:hypothetical protein